MISEYIQALLLIFLAEMGDKTQILAMLFSTRFPVKKVLLGVAIGSFLNHGIAVIFGRTIGMFIPVYILQIVAGVAFLGFALWTVLENEEEDIEQIKEKKSQNAIVTVAMAFFIGELGDKTQLSAITLSVDATYPVFILLGTVTGMVLVSGIGIFVGSKVGHKIPDTLLQIISCLVFALFGSIKLLGSVPKEWQILPFFIVFIGIVATILILVIKKSILWRRTSALTAYQKAADVVYDYFQYIKDELNQLCRGEAYCGVCEGRGCAVGAMKAMVRSFEEKGILENQEAIDQEITYIQGKFSEEQLKHALKETVIALYKHYNKEIDVMRIIFEKLLFGESISWTQNKGDYLQWIQLKDGDLYKQFL